jgi:hypothetical protein
VWQNVAEYTSTEATALDVVEQELQLVLQLKLIAVSVFLMVTECRVVETGF